MYIVYYSICGALDTSSPASPFSFGFCGLDLFPCEGHMTAAQRLGNVWDSTFLALFSPWDGSTISRNLWQIPPRRWMVGPNWEPEPEIWRFQCQSLPVRIRTSVRAKKSDKSRLTGFFFDWPYASRTLLACMRRIERPLAPTSSIRTGLKMQSRTHHHHPPHHHNNNHHSNNHNNNNSNL